MRRRQDKNGPKFNALFKAPSLADFSVSSVRPNFTFVVENKIYKCKAIQLCSVSEVISNRVGSSVFLSPSKTNYEKSEILASENTFFENFFYNFNLPKNNLNSQNSNNTQSKTQCLKLKDPHQYFPIFLDSINGKEISINKFNAFFLNYIATVLDIKQLINATEPFMAVLNDGLLTVNNCIQIHEYFSEHNIQRKEVIDFIVSNWSKLDFSYETLICYSYHATDNDDDYDPTELRNLKKLLKMPYEFFDFIFSHPSFKPRSSQWIPCFVNLLIDTNSKDPEHPNPDFVKLLKYCEFQKIPNNFIDQIINSISYDQIPIEFLDKIEQRFCSKVDPKSQVSQLNVQPWLAQMKAEKKKKVTDFIPKSQQPTQSKTIEPISKPSTGPSNSLSFPFTQNCNKNFNGVFSYFINNGQFKSSVQVYCGGSKKKFIRHLFEYDQRMFEFSWDSFSPTEGSTLKNAWLVFSFHYHKLKLDNYTLATSPVMPNLMVCNGIQPISWLIVGCDDYFPTQDSIKSDTNWTKIDLQLNNRILVQKTKVIETFPTENAKSYRSFKFSMLANDEKVTDWANQLKLNAIEFYGTLTPVSG